MGNAAKNTDILNGGISNQHLEKNNESKFNANVSNYKIKVFISSMCGDNGKYDNLRFRLREELEKTNLIQVYVFESEGASILTARHHYTFALRDSDVCIFIIDNKDGISKGVQEEIDIVNKYKIKALYYFCDEHSEVKTSLQECLMGADFAKSRTIHTFDDLIERGVQWLINDVITVYHNYCKDRFILIQDNNDSKIENIDILRSEQLSYLYIPQFILEKTDKCSDYILNFILGKFDLLDSYDYNEIIDIDKYACLFLKVLIEGCSIKNFNINIFLNELKKYHTEQCFQIVRKRWDAIKSYFLDDIQQCIKCLNDALLLAKENEQHIWIENDILIDIRNQILIQNKINNSDVPEQYPDIVKIVYYPILDRLQKTINEKYVEGLYKKKFESKYILTIGYDLKEYSLKEYCKLLASSYIVSLYYGSLTHILWFYKQLKNFLFYLCCKYDDWNFRRDLFKFVIYDCDKNGVEEINRLYPEVINHMTDIDAEQIMKFCSNNPIKDRHFISQLLAFGAVGYYLNDEMYIKYESIIVDKIKNMLYKNNYINNIGKIIFECLSGVAYRISQNNLAEICFIFMDNHCCYYYADMFQFFYKYIDLRSMKIQVAHRFVDYIIDILENEEERKLIKETPYFLCVLRNQDKNLTKDLDLKIQKYLPEYYEQEYKLETSEKTQELLSDFLKYYIISLEKVNNEYEVGGMRIGQGSRIVVTIKHILQTENFNFDSNIIDSLIPVIVHILLKSKQGITTKWESLSLLIYIVLNYYESYEKNISIFNDLFKNKNEIDVLDDFIMSYNVDGTALKIGLNFLFCCMNKDVYFEILEFMPYIEGNISAITELSGMIAECLEFSDSFILNENIELIVLQYAMQWMFSDQLSIRINSVRILLKLLRNPNNRNIINKQIVSIVDRDNAIIKDILIRNIDVDGISETVKKYIIDKCSNDFNFVIRKRCIEKIEKVSFNSNAEC